MPEELERDAIAHIKAFVESELGFIEVEVERMFEHAAELHELEFGVATEALEAVDVAASTDAPPPAVFDNEVRLGACFSELGWTIVSQKGDRPAMTIGSVHDPSLINACQFDTISTSNDETRGLSKDEILKSLNIIHVQDLPLCV